MIANPDELSSFFTTAAGAAATLIGLLSVANSVVAQKDNSESASLEQGILAESAYGAFANIFFVALAALVPFVNVGYAVLIMAIVGFITLRRVQGRGLHKLNELNKRKAQISRGLVLASVLIYGAEVVIGGLLIFDKADNLPWMALTYAILALYGIGLARAWELLGVRRVLR